MKPMPRHPGSRAASRVLILLFCCAAVWVPPLTAKKHPKASSEDKAGPAEAGLPSVASKTAGWEAREGFLTFYYEASEGRLWLELPPPEGPESIAVELVYIEGLTSGLGSNPVGLDRGQVSDSKLLRIRRLGPRVLIEQPNLGFRAVTERLSERRATAESFATSVIWGQDVAALDPDGRSLVDFTTFVVRDAHDVSTTLAETEQGSYSLDPGRSAVDPAECRAFPDNLELEALLTFAGTQPGGEVEATAPTPTSITLRQHHSLVRLPDDGYRPRRFDPRIGLSATDFHDYAAPLDEPLIKRYALRHRLQKSDPAAERSPAVEPLVFYVDPGIPEPVRSAVLDGARWWAEAFEAAGFVDAYRVELLPDGAHPLDVRYNVIQWVHRATRGWSYGTGVTDPRTGEILKGHVNLGSLRVRQDRLLFEGLAGTSKTGSGEDDDPVELALARIRQLSAHEVGHTLGIGHNFAASTYGDRESVMDYPAPLVLIGDDGELDFSRAYGVGIGEWDVHTIRYGYSHFAPGTDEEVALEAIVRQGIADGLVFITDEDARPPGASEPRANLWDNGTDAVAGLELSLAVRRLALERFGEDRVLPGTALAELEEVLAPVYFHHRFQLAAAAKVVGGMEYNYALRGDGQWATRIVEPERQRRGLEVILGILSPEHLDIPEEVLGLIAPRPFQYEPHREMFASRTWPAFDALGAARTVADQVVTALLQPERLGRLYDFHRRDGAHPGVEEVAGALIEAAFGRADGADGRPAALWRAVQRVVSDRLITTAAHPELRPAVRALLEQALREGVLPRLAEGDPGAHQAALRADVRRFLDRAQDGAGWVSGPPAEPPPGQPIGMPAELGACSHGGGY